MKWPWQKVSKADRDYARTLSGSRTWCNDHGPDVKIDEDGCCTQCGAHATGKWATRAAHCWTIATKSIRKR